MLYLLCLLLTSCTFSINVLDTHGKATDVIDEDQEATPKIDPTVSLPVV